MTNRIGTGRELLIWKLPDKKPDPSEGYISIHFPHPFMRLPGAEGTITTTITRKLPAMILSPRGGKRWPFDLGIIRPNMPASIRERMIRKIVEDAINDERRRKPAPAIKAPPKGDGKEYKTEASSKGFLGIARVDRAARKTLGLRGNHHVHSVNATLGTNNFSVALAAHVSAATFVRR